MPFSQSLPEPPEQTAITLYRWPAGRMFHRIHAAQYGAAEFNESPHGSARFSPLRGANGAIIPTLYGGETFECAAMETVFHDVPFVPGLKTIAKRRLEARCVSRITAQTDLSLIDLSAIALRKLGLMRKQLIDTEADCYPQTRRWALALYHQHPECQGLCWVSRQDDTARALLLFGDRLPEDALSAEREPQGLLDDADLYRALLMLAERLGVQVDGGE